jgi:CelD/BcsL family acetyltransferase involved in cellulose biosynthesis
MRRPTIFSTWEWIHTWWKHFGRGYGLFVLFVRRGDELVGILPLARRLEWIEEALLPGRVLGYCGSRELYSDHVDVIAAEKDASECVGAVIEFLHREYRDWDVLRLSHVGEDSSVLSFVRASSIPFAFHARVVSSSPYLRLGGTFDEYRATLSRAGRSKLKRAWTVAREQLGLIYDAPRDVAVPGAIREAFQLQNLRAAEKGVTSNFRGEPLASFHAEFATLADGEGRLRMRFLRYGGRPIAFWYCFALHGRVYAYQQGFDPEWGDRKVATVLLYDVIDEACREGMTELDLLRGASDFKSRWTEHQRDLLDVTLYNNTLPGAWIRQMSRGRDALAGRVKPLLRRGR